MEAKLKDFGELRHVRRSTVEHSTVDGIEGKICRKCGEWHPLTDYFKNKNMKDGRATYCKECMRGYITKERPNQVQECTASEKPETQFDILCRLTKRLEDAKISEILEIKKEYEDWGLHMVALTEGLDGKEVVDAEELNQFREDIKRLEREKNEMSDKINGLKRELDLKAKDLNRLNDKDIMLVLRSESCKPRYLIDRISEISPNYRISYHDPVTDIIMPCYPDSNNSNQIKV